MKIYFAPMEGITDGILRSVHQDVFSGIDVYCLPFHKLTQSLSLTARETRDADPEENAGLTVLPQALTRDPSQLLAWMDYIAGLQYRCADLNLGCPSPTVTKRGRGSGMLRDPGFLLSFLDYVFARDLPVSLSVKTRIGFDDTGEWPRILSVLAEYPFDHMTIHVRTAKEQYICAKHPEAFDMAIREGIPHLVYNGDLRTTENVSTLLARCPETEAIMIGRGLLADPSLARQLRGGKKASTEELSRWYSTLYVRWKERFGATVALGRIKKLMEWPSEGNIKKRRLLRRADSIEECIQAILSDNG